MCYYNMIVYIYVLMTGKVERSADGAVVIRNAKADSLCIAIKYEEISVGGGRREPFAIDAFRKFPFINA